MSVYLLQCMCNVFILNIERGYVYIIGTFTLGVEFSKKIAEYEIPSFVWIGKYIDGCPIHPSASALPGCGPT